MKKILIPFFITALIGTTNLTVSANPWRPDTDEYEQSTAVETSCDFPSSREIDSDDSTWKFISAIDEVRESATDIETLIENIKSTEVKTDTREFKVSDIQVLDYSGSLASVNKSAKINDINDTTVKIFYDGGNAWVEFPIGKHSEPDANTQSTGGNSYGFTLPLDRADLLTNCLECRFGCMKDGKRCEWCEAHITNDFRTSQHNGLDITWSGIGGSSIRAVSNGNVYTRGNDPTGWGNYVSIKHGSSSLITLYAHMRSEALVSSGQSVNQGTIIGYVGRTGEAYNEHLHIEVWINSINNRVDPLPYLQGAQPYASSSSGGSTSDPELYLYAPGTYKICDGPLTLRAVPNSGTTSYGTLPNGTIVNISEIQKGDGSFVFGKISAGANTGKWIALGTTGIDIYAANTSVMWKVFDGPLNIRQTSSTSSQSYGTITNGSTFKITDVITSGNFILAKIADSPAPTLASGSTCTVANAKNHWLALEYCEPIR